jgi:hypothetical protein
MSQNYKFKSLEIIKETQKKQDQNYNSEDLKVYEVGDTRTIDFVMLDGTRQNFPYSHYLTSWLGMENEERVIKIFFATHLVTIKGYCLDQIYNELIVFNLKSLKSNTERYLGNVNTDTPFITSISITWKKETNHNIDYLFSDKSRI